ncbi:MAG: FKBP-type peptidyl-prolyl cis-trans isomerase [Deltaproteobacteria bacterium]
MKRTALIATALLIGLSSSSALSADLPLENEEQKTFYALGLQLGDNLKTFELTEEEVVFVQQGMRDGALGREPAVDAAQYRSKFRALAQERSKARAAVEKKAGEAFLTAAAAKSGAEKTDSGLVYQTVTEGKGVSPKATDRVKVHYTGKLLDGTVFDSSVERGTPATFPLNGVISCWTEGVQKMKVGGKAQLVCPSDIAYGDRGAPPNIQPGATLVFDVELLEIIETKAPGKVESPAAAE